jgi:hypothetical protein
MTAAEVLDEWWEVRWLCPKCSRFVPESTVDSEDVWDPSAYYGFTTRTWAHCKKCGPVDEPRCIPTKAHPLDHKEAP